MAVSPRPCPHCKGQKERDGYQLCRDCSDLFFTEMAPAVRWMATALRS